ncbi:MAG: glutathione S-transferase [Candidatus Azotimanducaceae bacterium]|jgi:glutathione S-transferase
MYQLYIANKNYSSWSLRPWILMRELDIAFVEKFVCFAQTDNHEAFRVFAPNGKVPCLLDDGLGGGEQAIWDSLGITEYLYEFDPRVWPDELAARVWARCAVAEMHGGFDALRHFCTMNVGIRVALNDNPDSLQREVARIDELWSQGLQRFGGPFLAGQHYTAVDAFYAPVIFRLRTYGLSLSAAASVYVDHMLQRPAMLEWEHDALQETYREQGHEAEVHAMGRITIDYRNS